MHLEKLGLLEKRLGRFIERFEQLVAENMRLHERLEAQAQRVRELEEEVGRRREREERVRARVDRFVGIVGKLEEMERTESETPQ